jgi:hypothetical protein
MMASLRCRSASAALPPKRNRDGLLAGCERGLVRLFAWRSRSEESSTEAV